jgi:hypothetical protein
MAKTYPDIGTFSPGDILTAATMNDVGTNLDNQRVPPSCRVYRSSDLTSYTSNTAITWNAEDYDTDGMFTASSTDITIGTTGIYLVVLNIFFTATATVTNANALIYAGASPIQSRQSIDLGSTSGVMQQHGVFQLTASTVLTARLALSGGSAYVVKGDAAANSNGNSYMAVTWLGQAS